MGKYKFSVDYSMSTIDYIECMLVLIIMYMLIIYQRFLNKVAKRDNPFSNAGLLSFLIFSVVVQKYIIESLFATTINKDLDSRNTIVVIRQTMLAIELLFVIIPIRHNFSLEHLESWQNKLLHGDLKLSHSLKYLIKVSHRYWQLILNLFVLIYSIFIY